MKTLTLFAVFSLFASFAFSQNTQYNFSIAEITTAVEAKKITDSIIRKAFYVATDSKTVEVHFDDESDLFTVYSKIEKTEIQLKEFLQTHQLTLISFELKH